MVKEKSVGCALFRIGGNVPEFLLLHYKAGHWGFPKGHVEQGETEEQTMRREVCEETTIEQIKIIPGFRQETKYFFRRGNETVFKEVSFYLVEALGGNVKISHEHKGFEWLSFEKALERLTFENTKNVLEKARGFMQSNKICYA
ncbi:MAG: NUDIX domain-containing protein [archaeon]